MVLISPLRLGSRVTVDPKVVEWLDKTVRQKTFRSRSHGVEFGLAEMKRNEEHRRYLRKLPPDARD